jgi:DNA repair protein RadC
MQQFENWNELVGSYEKRLRKFDYEMLFFSFVDITKRWVFGELEKTIHSKTTAGNVILPEILRHAVLSRADYMLMLHNHIDEDAEPSSNDIQLTAALYFAGNLIQIPLVDSIITSNVSDSFSFDGNGMLNICGVE